jgi:predicted kinase
MMKADHNVSVNSISDWHSEGSVWTHTMMVMTCIEMNSNEEYYKSLLIAGMLHDCGKPLALTYDEEKNKNRFSCHEGFSTFLSIEVLRKLKIDFNLSETIIKDALKIISLHGTNISQYEKISPVKAFRRFDKMGAVRRESPMDDYSPRKFAPNLNMKAGECILMCGLPCSGKSTYIKENLSDYTVISRDDLITENDDNYNRAYRDFHENPILKKSLEKRFGNMIMNARKDEKIVVDMTMLSLKSRRAMMSRIGPRNYKAIVLFEDIETIMTRNESRENKYIGSDVLSDMMKAFVLPVHQEGFSEIKIIGV